MIQAKLLRLWKNQTWDTDFITVEFKNVAFGKLSKKHSIVANVLDAAIQEYLSKQFSPVPKEGILLRSVILDSLEDTTEKTANNYFEV